METGVVVADDAKLGLAGGVLDDEGHFDWEVLGEDEGINFPSLGSLDDAVLGDGAGFMLGSAVCAAFAGAARCEHE